MSRAAETFAVLAALAASLGALARTSTRRPLHNAGIPLLLAGWIGLLACLAPDGAVDRWYLAAPVGLAGLAAVWLLAGRLVGRETWLLAAGAAVLTLRVPVPTGDADAMLLAPLYAIIALTALVVVRRERRHSDRTARLPDLGGATRLLDIATVLVPLISGLSIIWSFEREDTAGALAFFLVPFLLAYAVVRTLLADGVPVRPAAITLVAVGLVAAAVGLFQAVTRQVWWNPKVIDANRFRPDFRTNSVFWDPNIYGRALVVAALAVIAWLLVARMSRRAVLGGGAVLVVLAAALWATYSQSSWFALAVALVFIAVLTLPPNPRRWAAAALAVVALVGLPLASQELAGSDAEGRGSVVREGLGLAGEKPVVGWGAASFEAAATARAAERGEQDPGLLASHTTPVTVIAELGVLGMAAYIALLAAALVTVLARWRRTSTPAAAARARGDAEAGTGWPIAPVIWAGGAVAALFAHSLLYAGFFEDATLWVALAVLASLPLVQDEEQHENGARDAAPASGSREDAVLRS